MVILSSNIKVQILQVYQIKLFLLVITLLLLLLNFKPLELFGVKVLMVLVMLMVLLELKILLQTIEKVFVFKILIILGVLLP